MTDLFDSPAQSSSVEIPRDRWGRPLIIPPDGGDPVPYTRCTRFVGAIEDMYALGLWEQRMVALGLAERQDLLLAVGAHRDDKKKLDKICADAKEAAKAHAAATTGTALHKIVETIDLGLDPGVIPAAYRADIAAYRQATAHFTPVHIEQFVVLDQYRVAGTPDRVVEVDGRRYVSDLKTGSIDFGALKISMQLAAYSRSRLYRPATGAREPLDVDLDRALVVHLPAGVGQCEIRWIDIAIGWTAVSTAAAVWEWRKVKADDLYEPVDIPARASIAAQVRTAASTDELIELWRTYSARGLWTDGLTALASVRKRELS